MAITTTTRRAGPFIGNDTTTIFPFNFKVFAKTDLLVIRVDSGGNLVVLVLGTDYTATLNDDQDVSPGGSVTLTAAPLASTYSMIITSDVAELQQVILTNLGGFFPDVLNDALDRLTILVQQLQTGVDQSIKFGLTDDLSTASLPSAAQRAGKFMYFGADGSVSLVAQAPTSGTGTQFAFAGPLLGTKNGSNTIFTITNGGSPIGKTPVDILVWDNFVLAPGIGYTLGPSAGQVQFTVAPGAADDLYAKGVFVP